MSERLVAREPCGDWDYPVPPRFGRPFNEPYIWIEPAEEPRVQKELIDQLLKAYLRKELHGRIRLELESLKRTTGETRAVKKLRKEVMELRAQVKELKEQRVLVTEQVLGKLWDNEYDEQWNSV